MSAMSGYVNVSDVRYIASTKSWCQIFVRYIACVRFMVWSHRSTLA